MRLKFLDIETAANTMFFERQEEIHGMLLAALSGQHIFFIGPPGTAKSMMIRWMCEHFEGANYFT